MGKKLELFFRRKSYSLLDQKSCIGQYQKFDFPIIGPKIKVVTPRVTYQNKRERGTKPMEKKLEHNRTYQFEEKSQKPSKNAHIYMWEGFGGFFGFFSELVSPIEL